MGRSISSAGDLITLISSQEGGSPVFSLAVSSSQSGQCTYHIWVR